MGEIAVTLAKWFLKLAFFIAVILSVMVLVGVITSYLVVGFSVPVLHDLFALIQIWLPFNLNVLLIWITLSASAYVAYRLAIMTYNMFNSYLGTK